MEKLKIGIIGCGGIMNNHVNYLLTFNDVEIVAVADPRSERTEAMMKRTGAKRAYPSHKELFAKEDKLNAVYIAVEPTAHIGIEETAIEMNLPFLVEKPMTLDLTQAKAIAKAVDEKNFLGVFQGLGAVAAGVTAAVLFGVIAALIFKPKCD